MEVVGPWESWVAEQADKIADLRCEIIDALFERIKRLHADGGCSDAEFERSVGCAVHFLTRCDPFDLLYGCMDIGKEDALQMAAAWRATRDARPQMSLFVDGSDKGEPS